jgi:SufS family cysteine desulfurase
MDYRRLYPFFSIHPDVHYLDSAATALMPEQVIVAIDRWNTQYTVPIGRSIYPLGEEATALYESSRAEIARFCGAQSHELVFTRSATDGITCVARSWAQANLRAGDEIILTTAEHHASWVTWHELARSIGAIIRVVPLLQDGFSFDYEAYEQYLCNRTRLVVFPYISNVLGTRADVARIVRGARQYGSRTLCDAAQSAASIPIDFAAIGVDFLVFSGHKLGGPQGIGVLLCAESVHLEIEPSAFGGGMVFGVAETTSYRPMPHLLEPGSPNGMGAYGLAAAVRGIAQFDRDAVYAQYEALSAKAYTELCSIRGVRVISDPESLSIVSFVVEGVHPHDGAALLGNKGVLVRAGFQCAQPLHAALGLSMGSLRASFGPYSTREDVTALIDAIRAI